MQTEEVEYVLVSTISIHAWVLGANCCTLDSTHWCYDKYVGRGGERHDAHFHLTNYIQEGTDIKKLTPDAKEKVTKGNYERLFDKAREQVRDWEEANL